MVKTILVPVTGVGSHEALYKTALEAARPFGAHIEFVAADTDPVEAVSPPAYVYLGRGAAVNEMQRWIEAGASARIAAARRFFDDFCNREHIPVVDAPPGPGTVSAAWREPQDDKLTWLVRRARVSDLLICGHDLSAEGPYRQMVSTALMSSGRPLLLSPSQAPPMLGRTLAIGWKDSPEAAHAVTAAMPFLITAARITVLTINEGGESNLSSMESLVEQLRWHGLNVNGSCIAAGQDTAPQALVSTALRLGADLLVMGAYGRSQLRTFIFGGFTRHVLGQSDMAVLMCH